MKKTLRTVGRWTMNVLISLDQLGNSILGGDPDETISSRLGRIKTKWGGEIPSTRPVAKVTDWFLDRIDKNHSVDAIEHDEGHDGLRDKPLARLCPICKRALPDTCDDIVRCPNCNMKVLL